MIDIAEIMICDFNLDLDDADATSERVNRVADPERADKPIGRGAAQDIAHQRSRPGIEFRRRLVGKDLSVGKEHPRDADTKPLSTRKIGTALLDDGVKSARQKRGPSRPRRTDGYRAGVLAGKTIPLNLPIDAPRRTAERRR